MDALAALCRKHGIGHVINNAYGLQCAHIRRLVNRACTIGRVDYVVQSTDKNFMVPVGGAIVASPIPGHIDAVARGYAGRASIGPVLDVFMTLLSMGELQLRRLLEERERLFEHMRAELVRLSQKYPSLRVLSTPDNHISLGLALDFTGGRAAGESVTGVEGQGSPSLDATPASLDATPAPVDVNSIGSILFHKCISGARLIYRSSKSTVVNGYTFVNWGSHHDQYPYMPYLTVAVAIGMTEHEIHRFVDELGKVLAKFQKKAGFI